MQCHFLVSVYTWHSYSAPIDSITGKTPINIKKNKIEKREKERERERGKAGEGGKEGDGERDHTYRCSTGTGSSFNHDS